MGFFELSKEDKEEIRKNTGILVVIGINLVAIILGIIIIRFISVDYLVYSLIASLIVGMGYINNIIMKLFKIKPEELPANVPSIPTPEKAGE